MRAIRIYGFGAPEVMMLEDAPAPVINDDEVLVRVHAAGINPVDAKTRAGGGVARPDHSFPITLGWDVSGVVAAVGGQVTRFVAGDAVFGMSRFPAYAGAYAQLAAVRESELAHKPASVDHVHAAAAPLAALTAWQALFDTAGLRAGQRVLIQAAAGGVGHIAVQLARNASAHVIAITSPRNEEFVRGLGAHEVIDYTSQQIENATGEIDIALDCLRGQSQTQLLSTLKPGGKLISIVGLPAAERAAQAGVQATNIVVRPSAGQMSQIADQMATGRLKIHVAQLFPMADVVDSHRELERGHTRGKLVLHIDP